MKKNSHDLEKKDKIGRRKALIETGKYTALVATTMMFLVSVSNASGPPASFTSVPKRIPKKR
jgi:hypothetical protein